MQKSLPLEHYIHAYGKKRVKEAEKKSYREILFCSYGKKKDDSGGIPSRGKGANSSFHVPRCRDTLYREGICKSIKLTVRLEDL